MDPAIRKLLFWYTKHGRELPWRNTRDAYRIFISELMLQQTQVDRVIPKYESWLHTFPTWKSLAEAKTADVIHAWAGLGYNRRALYARDAARQVVASGVPKSETEWRTLKGVGPYMAAALSEFADHSRAVVIDTNVRRVAGRIFLGIPFPVLSDDERIRRILERVTPKAQRHWDVPQAFMDLANAACLPRTPECATCPLKETCSAQRKFSNTNIALRKPKKASTESIRAEKKYPDRIYRGRILALVREHGTIQLASVGERIDKTFDRIADTDWIRAMAERLAKDGLLIIRPGDILSLPHS